MKVYGYCRISTSKQSMERQIRNIKLAYPDVVIVKETCKATKGQAWISPLPALYEGDVSEA